MTASGPPCPRCGAAMVERHNRQDGSAFLGCTRFPDCRGTRPVAATPAAAPASRTTPTPPRTRRTGRRRLNAWQSFALRLALIAVVVVLAINLIGPFSTWFGRYAADVFVQSMATPAPSPTP